MNTLRVTDAARAILQELVKLHEELDDLANICADQKLNAFYLLPRMEAVNEKILRTSGRLVKEVSARNKLERNVA